MQGSKKVLDILSDVLTGELTAINQYFMHARLCDNWGYTKLAKVIQAESIDEMKHAQELMDRILFFDAIPNLQKLSKLNIGENVEEQFKADLALEFSAIKRLKDGIKVCIEESDFGSRDLLERILVDEEKHVDWLEAQLSVIKDIGLKSYLAEQIA